MNNESEFSLKTVRFSAIAVAILMAGGIVTVMLLARGTGEDITGVVAPALLITFLAIATAVVVSVLLRKGRLSRPK